VIVGGFDIETNMVLSKSNFLLFISCHVVFGKVRMRENFFLVAHFVYFFVLCSPYLRKGAFEKAQLQFGLFLKKCIFILFQIHKHSLLWPGFQI